jgi:ATP-dependent DNA helicase RecG
MPSALEKLVKILKLEQNTGYNNTAVIGGMESFADNWQQNAHQQAKIPEHHQLVDEMVARLHEYGALPGIDERHEAIKYMLGRIMGRLPAPPNLPPSSYVEPEPPDQPTGPEAASVGPTKTEPDFETYDDESDDGGEEFAESDEITPHDDEIYDDQPPHDDAPVERQESPREKPVPSFARRRKGQPLSPEEAARQFVDLQAPVTTLHKVGEKMAEKMARLGIHTLEDMLFTFPRRYDDYTQLRTLDHLHPGEAVTIIGAVRSITRKQGRSGTRYLSVMLDDSTGSLQVFFFGQPWLQRQFRRGSQVVMSGEVEIFRGGLAMTNPEWEMMERENLHTNRIVPVYPLTKGIAARTMRRLMRQALNQWGNRIPDYIPESVLDRTELPDLSWAIQQIHFPDSMEALEQGQRRMSFDELFLFQMAMQTYRRDWQAEPGPPLAVSDEWLDQFVGTLPYPLTGAQQRALTDIRNDIARDVPMNRLLQGDVGSGKTVIAAAALAIAVQNGKQAALMAPTSILAEQHARTIGALLAESPGGEHMQVRLLTGNTGEAERQEIYAGLAEGSVNVIIGTHAIIQENVEFHDLALAVIDEQHRFGVQQRGSLRGKGTHPHILVMTATPIPRTLALTLYADLDLSIIDEMPPGRTPVETRVLRRVERERAYSFVESQIDKGRQAFIIYPLVETSEALDDVGAATTEYDRLKTEVFSGRRVGLLHGRMNPAEKEAMMHLFAAGEIDILVATSVVEVGIDVPNASVMLIEDADRFGLAQLHQFRGRVGRGEHKSFCLLVAGQISDTADQRLQAMEETTDGFKLAEFDWEMRGAGDLLGLRQSGIGQFRLAEIMNPQQVELAQREARTVYAEDSNLSQPEHQLLAHRIQTLRDRRSDVS